METHSLWKKGLLAGLITLVGVVIATLISILFVPEGSGSGAAMVIGTLLLCFYQFWIIASPIFSIWLYQRSGNVISLKDGLFIGGSSGIFLVVLALGFGILRETVFYNPDDIVRGGAIFVALVSAVLILIGGCVGGFLGAIVFQKSQIVATPTQAEITNNSIQDKDGQNIKQPVIVAAAGKSPVIAALLSLFLFGGAGQIYLGQWKKGIALILAFLLSLVSTLIITTIVVIGIVAIGTGDAYGIAQRLKNGNAVGEWEFSINWKIGGLGFLMIVAIWALRLWLTIGQYIF